MARPLFTVAGIPVRIDPAFIFGALLIYLWSGGGTHGIYAVVALAIFLFIHEMGHAVVARHFGAKAGITVGFLGGYTSYVPPATITRGQQIAISAAGSATQLIVALPALYATLLWTRSVAQSADFTSVATFSALETPANVYAAVAWAGVLLALLNLIPALPFDGGRIVERLLRGRFGDATSTIMARWSYGVAAVLALMYVISGGSERNSPLYLTPPQMDLFDPSFVTMMAREGVRFVNFLTSGSLFVPLIIVLGAAAEGRARAVVTPKIGRPGEAPPLDAQSLLAAVESAERSGWATGTVPPFPAGFEPSPWLVTYAAQRRGDTTTAQQAPHLLSDVRERRWVRLPDPNHPAILDLLQHLPPDVADSAAVLEMRVHAGSVDDFASAIQRRVTATGAPSDLYLGAAGFATRGYNDSALAWLERAVSAEPSATLLATAPEFGSLRGDPRFEQLLERAQVAEGV
ncbi:MAG TPA: M50 family metallopeptidase [Microthrixaceae bacterium]|nr:M50 family metallopeptidase [Microthrixaceae bacterium]